MEEFVKFLISIFYSLVKLLFSEVTDKWRTDDIRHGCLLKWDMGQGRPVSNGSGRGHYLHEKS